MHLTDFEQLCNIVCFCLIGIYLLFVAGAFSVICYVIKKMFSTLIRSINRLSKGG